MMTAEAQVVANAMLLAAERAAREVARDMQEETLRFIINNPNLPPLVRSAAADVSRGRPPQ